MNLTNAEKDGYLFIVTEPKAARVMNFFTRIKLAWTGALRKQMCFILLQVYFIVKNETFSRENFCILAPGLLEMWLNSSKLF